MSDMNFEKRAAELAEQCKTPSAGSVMGTGWATRDGNILDDLAALRRRCNAQTGLDPEPTPTVHYVGMRTFTRLLEEGYIDAAGNLTQKWADDLHQTISRIMNADADVKQVEDLLAMGGKFYVIGDDHWCDTATDSWKLVPGTGYVRHEG